MPAARNVSTGKWRRCVACCATGASGIGIIVLLLVALTFRSQSAWAKSVEREDRAYHYYSYDATLAYFENLKSKCPEIIDTYVAQEVFPEILPQGSSPPWAKCGGSTCKTLIVRVTNRALLTETTPEVYFSGALHGDEQIGPVVVTELAGFLCEGWRSGDEDIKRLVDGRSTWITPMTNVDGFARHRRDENGMDPNRDFPYLQKTNMCMRTQTARTVNELFRRHLFQFELTFHGGMRALTYEWGSKNHMRGRSSSESPDDWAFSHVGKYMQDASGVSSVGKSFYPLGRITDAVYPVDGGLEDWSYGAGWEAAPNPIPACKPTTYGGYAPERTQYRRDSLSALVYLAEMDDAKTPREASLGKTGEMWRMTGQDGHVARNMRMCLQLIELTKPEVVFRQPSWASALQPGTTMAIEVRGFGCFSVSLRLLLLKRGSGSCGQLSSSLAQEGSDQRKSQLTSATAVASLGSHQCKGIEATVWKPSSNLYTKLEGRIPEGLALGEYCTVLAAEFDQEWAKQSNPDPHVPPRSHAVRSRIEEHYIARATEGNMRIDSYRTKVFAVQPVTLVAAGSPVIGNPVPAPAPYPAIVAAPDTEARPPSSQNSESGGAASPTAPTLAPAPTPGNSDSTSSVELGLETSAEGTLSAFLVVAFCMGVFSLVACLVHQLVEHCTTTNKASAPWRTSRAALAVDRILSKMEGGRVVAPTTIGPAE